MPVTIRLIDYTDTRFLEQELSNAGDCRPYLSDTESTTWLHVQGGASVETLRELVSLLHLHPLAVEDVANGGQRAKLEEYGELLFVVIHLPVVDDGGRTRAEQVSMFLGAGFLVWFHHGAIDPFGPVRARLRAHSDKIRSRRSDYDHTVQIMDLMESYREMAASMLEVYLSSVSNRLNETMRLLTVIATIFIPLTFVAGVYGMNFGNNTDSRWAMPELRWAYGYPAIWLVMIAIAGLMLYLFKRNKWL